MPRQVGRNPEETVQRVVVDNKTGEVITTFPASSIK